MIADHAEPRSNFHGSRAPALSEGAVKFLAFVPGLSYVSGSTSVD
jgi:hypothetical protein